VPHERSASSSQSISCSQVARAVLDGVLVNLAEYAVERRLLVNNPMTAISWKCRARRRRWTGGW
jgi:hypothetical protein